MRRAALIDESNTASVRRQLTLFVPPPAGSVLDDLRRRLDPVQSSIIAAHVTLCRDDEIVNLPSRGLLERVSLWHEKSLQMTFGQPQRFDGHGILLGCLAGEDDFQSLRRWVLDSPLARIHWPHITLAHPRNPRAYANGDTALAQAPLSLRLEFAVAALIQKRHDGPWRRVGSSGLGSGSVQID